MLATKEAMISAISESLSLSAISIEYAREMNLSNRQKVRQAHLDIQGLISFTCFDD